MADDVHDYAHPGPLASLDPTQLQLIESLPDDPTEICAAVQGLVIQPADATASGISEARLAEKNIRSVGALVYGVVVTLGLGDCFGGPHPAREAVPRRALHQQVPEGSA